MPQLGSSSSSDRIDVENTIFDIDRCASALRVIANSEGLEEMYSDALYVLAHTLDRAVTDLEQRQTSPACRSQAKRSTPHKKRRS